MISRKSFSHHFKRKLIVSVIAFDLAKIFTSKVFEHIKVQPQYPEALS